MNESQTQGYQLSAFRKLYDKAAEFVDQKIGWHRLPVPLGLAVLGGLRDVLRTQNLYDTSALPAVKVPPVAPATPEVRTNRTLDGTYNDLGEPRMGMAGSRFGRNVPLEDVEPEPLPRMMEPSPREVSRALLTRDELIPATSVNALVAAWLQFMIRDWFSHGKGTKENPWEIPLTDDDPWPARPMQVMRTRADPTAPPGGNHPPTHTNDQTPWWDASQIYGTTPQEQQLTRTGQDGKLHVSPDGLPPADTADYEYLLGHTRFTLFDVVAISGAAFSPLMGRATRSAYRIVFTLTNLRLGIWMPHPDVVRRARAYRKDGCRKDRWWTRWMLLLLLWYVSPNKEEWGELQQDREDRLWAHVLGLRAESTECRPRLRRTLLRLKAAVYWRVMQPTLGMLWAEAAGHTSYRATWINVTDGGHYDNLGLVEALHRGAKNIVVFDASGDRTDTWSTLGGAMALARTDAGVEIDLNPTTMVRSNGKAASLGQGEVLRPWARGAFTRMAAAQAQGNGALSHANGQGTDRELPGDGDIWVCKLGWWDQAPWDVRAYAAGHSTYPCDSTLQQLYDGAEFETYHELGYSAVRASAAGEEGALPLPIPLADRDGARLRSHAGIPW